MELIIPALIIISGSISSALVSFVKILVKKYYGCPELEKAVSRLITVLVCFVVTWILLPVFNGSLAGFLTVFLGVMGSSQLTYFTGINKVIDDSNGTV
jgi:hypothetical protein